MIPNSPSPLTSISTEALRLALHHDASEAWIALKQGASQVRRRNYVRAVFAFVEGFVSVLKRHALEEAAAGRYTASRAEVGLLFEESYGLKDNGEIQVRTLYPPVLPNLRFAFTVFAKAHRITSMPDFGGKGWQAFQEALEIRHRITHPKATVEISISDSELETIEQAHMWVLDSSFKVYVEGKATLLAELEIAKRRAADAAPSGEPAA
jgi:hypothetical protein